MLRRQGYEVWVVDPYDGTGNGPQDFEYFCKEYPGLRFVRELFTSSFRAAPPQTFDCIYSISVLEHVPSDALGALFAGMRRSLKPTGISIHAVDHVLKGRGADAHLAHLRKMTQLFGLEVAELQEVLERLQNDVETYYLSAESHNRWRGSMAYDDFPMRTCVSVQIAVAAASLIDPAGW